MDEFFIRNRLSAYIDGDLPSAEAREVEESLSRSPALRAEYESLRSAVTLLREHGPMAAPDGFEARLNERLAREPMPTGWRRWVRSVRPEVALIAALAAVALLYVGQRQDEPPAAATVPEAVITSSVSPPKPEAPATTGAPTADATPILPHAADGILGDEGFAAARTDAQKQRASGPPPGAMVYPNGPSTKSGVEREAYQPSWETNDADVRIVGDQVQVKPGGAADPQAVASANTAAANTATPSTAGKAGATVYSPPPFRYRVRSSDEATLKELAAVVTSLGGHLVDAQGRPVAIHMLDQGEVKTVRVLVPSGSVEALTSQLRALGDVEIMASDRADLYASGTEVPVQVELERE